MATKNASRRQSKTVNQKIVEASTGFACPPCEETRDGNKKRLAALIENLHS